MSDPKFVGYRFRNPPGWDPAPEGWNAPPGWRPPAHWPAAPAGWVFYEPVYESAIPMPAVSRPVSLYRTAVDESATVQDDVADDVHASEPPEAVAGPALDEADAAPELTAPPPSAAVARPMPRFGKARYANELLTEFAALREYAEQLERRVEELTDSVGATADAHAARAEAIAAKVAAAEAEQARVAALHAEAELRAAIAQRHREIAESDQELARASESLVELRTRAADAWDRLWGVLPAKGEIFAE